MDVLIHDLHLFDLKLNKYEEFSLTSVSHSFCRLKCNAGYVMCDLIVNSVCISYLYESQQQCHISAETAHTE